MAKDPIIQAMQQPTEWARKCTSYVSDRGLVSRVYKQQPNKNPEH